MNKPRLIDANALLDVLALEPMENRTYWRANEIVLEQPTAYNIDRVEEQIHGYFKEQLDIRTEGLQEYPIGLIDDLLSHNKAICEIVKGGAE